MSFPSVTPWSDNPYAPNIPYSLYQGEKAYLVGNLIGVVLYGVVIVLFFRCMGALFDPVNRARGGDSWGLVVHTTVMFSLATVYTAIEGNIQSASFIDNVNFPDFIDGIPGPIGYEVYVRSKPIGIVSLPIIVVNNWLADSLLLYRCYYVYAKNRKAIIVPCILFLGSLALGTLFIYKASQPVSQTTGASVFLDFGTPYFSVSFALNILLTFMIIARLVLHRRNLQKAIGVESGVGGLYKAIVTIFVESYALFAITALVYIATWGSSTDIQELFLTIIVQTQVIAPFLFTLRIANRKALTSEAIVSGKTSWTYFRSQEKQSRTSETLARSSPLSSMDAS